MTEQEACALHGAILQLIKLPELLVPSPSNEEEMLVCIHCQAEEEAENNNNYCMTMRMKDVLTMRVGFTGTRKGMTDHQKRLVRDLVRSLEVDEAHHGDCVGADSDFYHICRALEIPLIVAHPPLIDTLRAWTESDIRLKPRPYLARNRQIVNYAKVLIATPDSNSEQLRSGTWSTIRYARTKRRHIHIILPDGHVESEKRKLWVGNS